MISTNKLGGHVDLVLESRICLSASGLFETVGVAPSSSPISSGTIADYPNLITPADPSRLTGVTYQGVETRNNYDRRVDASVNQNVYIFTATYSNGSPLEVRVNTEFGSVGEAERLVDRYARVAGQMPASLMRFLDEILIQPGNELWGGGNGSVLIHAGNDYGSITEETFLHEVAHSLDSTYGGTNPAWVRAQNADNSFVSTYARDFPSREDLAETLVPYYGIRTGRSRLTPQQISEIEQLIPNRIAYLDTLGLLDVGLPAAQPVATPAPPAEPLAPTPTVPTPTTATPIIETPNIFNPVTSAVPVTPASAVPLSNPLPPIPTADPVVSTPVAEPVVATPAIATPNIVTPLTTAVPVTPVEVPQTPLPSVAEPVNSTTEGPTTSRPPSPGNGLASTGPLNRVSLDGLFVNGGPAAPAVATRPVSQALPAGTQVINIQSINGQMIVDASPRAQTSALGQTPASVSDIQAMLAQISSLRPELSPTLAATINALN